MPPHLYRACVISDYFYARITLKRHMYFYSLINTRRLLCLIATVNSIVPCAAALLHRFRHLRAWELDAIVTVLFRRPLVCDVSDCRISDLVWIQLGSSVGGETFKKTFLSSSVKWDKKTQQGCFVFSAWWSLGHEIGIDFQVARSNTHLPR